MKNGNICIPYIILTSSSYFKKEYCCWFHVRIYEGVLFLFFFSREVSSVVYIYMHIYININWFLGDPSELSGLSFELNSVWRSQIC